MIHIISTFVVSLVPISFVSPPPPNPLPLERKLIYPKSSSSNGLQHFLHPENSWNETIQRPFRFRQMKQSPTICLSQRDFSPSDSFPSCFLGQQISLCHQTKNSLPLSSVSDPLLIMCSGLPLWYILVYSWFMLLFGCNKHLHLQLAKNEGRRGKQYFEAFYVWKYL